MLNSSKSLLKYTIVLVPWSGNGGQIEEASGKVNDAILVNGITTHKHVLRQDNLGLFLFVLC